METIENTTRISKRASFDLTFHGNPMNTMHYGKSWGTRSKNELAYAFQLELVSGFQNEALLGQDQEWIEVWQGKVEVPGKQSAWIPFPTVPYRQKTPRFRYVKLGDTDVGAVAALEGRISLVQAPRSPVKDGNIFDFEALCEARHGA